MPNKKILVTGAGGFIGSHLVQRLAEQGKIARALVHYNSFGSIGWLQNLPDELLSSIEIVKGDIQDNAMMRELVSDCDTVINMAALIGIPYSYQAPSSYIDTNVRGTLNLLQAAKDKGVSCFIQISTSEVYGTAQYTPIDEKHPLNAQSPYAASKIAADQLALSFHASFGLPVTVIRPFNTFGPRQSQRAVIPTIIAQLVNGSNIITLGNTAATRDFTFVEDTADGIIAATNNNKNIAGETINLGTGMELTIKEIAMLLGNMFNRDIEIKSEVERIRPEKSEVDRLLSNNQKAKTLLNWEPKFSSKQAFEEALKLTVDWYEKPENHNYYTDTSYAV